VEIALNTPRDAAPRIALPWIIRLRYGMAAGQFLTTLVVRLLLGVDIPILAMAVGPVLVAATNVFLARQARDCAAGPVPTSRLVAWAFVLDTVCLTYVLMMSGGPANPFSLLYLVQITLSSIILTKRWTWALGGFSAFCFGLLFWQYRPIPALEMRHMPGTISPHLAGMWAGFAVAAFLVAMFSGKISELLRQHEASLLGMQLELAKRDRLASLATLAAGAAHELSTPLGTIAVVAREMESAAERLDDPSLVEDARLIRSEVERCRDILWRMSVQGAEPAGSALESVTVAELLQSVRSQFPHGDRLLVELPGNPPETTVRIPRRPVEQALVALVRNGLDAGGAEPVVLAAEAVAGFARFTVSDHGAGMSEEVLRRIAEPFFTTKEPGKGMGLGTFLARALAEQLGGSLRFESTVSVGTSATFEIPLPDLKNT
jgi:two-component system sensor histidine kinase RegB